MSEHVFDPHQLGVEAYLYLYPLVTTEVTRRAPMGQFAHVPAFPPAPGGDKEPNWLPAPPGPLGVTMPLCAPRPEALDSRWNPPPVRRVR